MQATHCPCEGELLCISFGLSYFELFCVKNNITAPYLISYRTQRRFLEWYQWGKISTLTALDVRLVVEAFHDKERQESELKCFNNKIPDFNNVHLVMVDFIALISSKIAGFCTNCDVTRFFVLSRSS